MAVRCGANATIVCGITIGEYAMIGSWTDNGVLDYALVVGYLGCMVGKVDKKGNRVA